MFLLIDGMVDFGKVVLVVVVVLIKLGGSVY